jgi:hypothetical protein
MKKLININLYSAFFAVGLLVLMAGCKKINTTSDLSSPRLFQPGSVSVATSQTAAVVTWTNSILTSGQKFKYTAQFSKDTLFSTIAFTLLSDTTGVTATDDSLTVRQKYYVRVKTNSYGNQPESKWAESKSFSITGEQDFLPVRDLEVKETSVTLRFIITTGLTKITLTANGVSTDYPIAGTEATTGIKVITGLTGGTSYSAEIFDGTKSRGLTSFTTKAVTVYSVILNAGADINAAIAAAANGAVIGLNPGVYTAGSTLYTVLQKSVTIKSTSGNPSDTKVYFNQFYLRGNGAGLNLSGIEFDGTSSGALYFINLSGAVADAEQVQFAPITVYNCVIHDATTSLLRANRGTNANDYKISQISFTGSVVYNIGSLLSYLCFHLDKLQFTTLTISECTFYNIGIGMLTAATTLSASTPPPVISIDACTINNFGAATKYALADASANPVKYSITNSIIANAPRPAGAVQNALMRASGTGSTIVFSNDDTFNLTNGSGTALTLPTTASASQTVNLGWTTSTTDFTLPVGSPLRNGGTTGGQLGDIRWAY